MEAVSNKLEDYWRIKPIREEKGKETFSSDDLIDAYLKGRKDAVDSEKQMRFEKLETNLDKAKNLSEKIYEMIKEDGFKCNRVKLKIKDIYNFSSIFLINENDYLNDRFLNIYKKSIRLKKEVNSDKTFDFTTIFAPINDEVEINNMLADGYIFSYELH
jgi:hypothetical protein